MAFGVVALLQNVLVKGERGLYNVRHAVFICSTSKCADLPERLRKIIELRNDKKAGTMEVLEVLPHLVYRKGGKQKKWENRKNKTTKSGRKEKTVKK